MRKEKVSNSKVKEEGFKCSHCGKWVSSKTIGTKHRNHCPFCLWSKHVDLKEPGDRESECNGEMEPIGLTFKKEGIDKYGEPKQGELMLIHKCLKCKKISINRIAGDDDEKAILKIFEKSQEIPKEEREKLKKEGIELILSKDKNKVLSQLYGNSLSLERN